MRSEKLQDAVGEVKDLYIQDACVTVTKKKNALMKWTALAACLCLAAGGILWLTRSGGTPANPLPKITVPAYVSGGGSFEGLLYYSADELKNGNPWREDANLKTLPVFKNGCYDLSGTGQSAGQNEEEMSRKLTAAAEALGLKIEKTERETGKDNDRVIGLRAVTDGGTLTVGADGTLGVVFPAGIALPEEYHFTFTDTSDKEAEAVLKYLAETYAPLLGFTRPETVVRGEYSFDGEYGRSYYVYDAVPDLSERILNYFFRSAQFGPDDEGNLIVIWLRDGLAKAEKLGDYPLITAAEARKKLLNGQYQTTVPEAMPGEEHIAKTEIVYRSGPNEETLLPYYRFWVELQDMDGQKMTQENGLKTFGAYYVPAVRDEYIDDFAVYDGRFN